MSMTAILLPQLVLALLCASVSASSASAPTGLLTSGRAGLVLHVEVADVRFGWIVPHLSTCAEATAQPVEFGQTQSSYRIVVGTSSDEVSRGNGSVFDSGVQTSSSSIHVTLPDLAAKLEPFSRYFWAVQTSTSTSAPTSSSSSSTCTSAWSAPAEFVTASLNTQFPPFVKPIWADKTALYAMARGDMTLPPSVTPSRVVAYVTGQPGHSKAPGQLLGAYKLFVNGKMSGVGPGRTDMGQFLHPTMSTVAQPVDAIDITDAVTSPTTTFGLQGYGGKMWLYVCVFTSSGPHPVASFATNSSTFTALNLATNSVLVPGKADAGRYGQHTEDWDATHYPVGWMTPGFTGQWSAAVEQSPFDSPLLVKATRPVAIGQLPTQPQRVAVNASYVFVDFEKEFMGGLQLAVATGNDPVTVNIRLGEERTSNTSILFPMRTDNQYESNFTFPANSNVTLSHHEYMEFRFGELRFSCPTCDKTTPAFTLTAWDVRYPFQDESSFSTSDSSLDAVYDLCHYTLTHAEVDTWTDSNTRERLPYGADGFIAGSGVFTLSRETAWVKHSFEFNVRHITWPTEWHQIFSLLAADFHMTTGETDMLNTTFDTLVDNSMLYAVDPSSQLVNFTYAKRLPGSRDVIDWPESERDGYVMSDVSSIVNAYAVAAFRSLATVADALGKTANATALRNQADATAAAMVSLMRAPDSHLFCDSVCSTTPHTAFQSSAFALWLDVVDDDASRATLSEWLFKRGMVGSVYAAFPYVHGLMKDVSDFGHRAIAAMTSTASASWLNMIKQGATMTMEAWTPQLKDNLTWSHPWATAPLSALIRYVLGFSPVTPTFATFRVQPQLGPLGFAKGTVPTLRGLVSIDVSQSGDVTGTYNMQVSVDVPAGTTAQICVRLVSGATSTVTLDGKAVKATTDGGALCVSDVGSGASPRVVALKAVASTTA